MNMVKIVCVTLTALTVSMFFGCGAGGNNPDNTERKFLFGMRNDLDGKLDFVAVTSDSAVISAVNDQLAKPVGERTLFINGKIEYGNGGNNSGWRWHFTPDQWSLTAMSTELCDGSPQLVEQDVDYWVGTVGRFCPWTSYVKNEITAAQ